MPIPTPLFTVLTACLALAAGEAQALTLGQAAQVAQTAQTAAFNTVELVAYNAQDRVPQWQRVKHALEADVVTLQKCLDDQSQCAGTAMTSWREMVAGLNGQDKMAQLSLVNSFFNRWQYRTDQDTYGVSERWASPIEFMQNSGDCEDYAIAKYVTLKFLGFSDKDMRIMAVMDNNRGIGHSVLSVATEDGKMIMDNLSDRVYADNQQTGYTPRFAVNQTGIYTYAQQPRVIMANYVQ